MLSSQPSIPWVEAHTPLPPAESALQSPVHLRGLVAAGEDLSSSRLLEAYSKGMFPWYSQGQPVLWWSPEPRMVLQVKDFRLHSSLKKTLRQFRRDPHCEIRVDYAFREVIRHCATRPRPGQSGTWIVPEMVAAYEDFHRNGHAHSVETWIEGQLVGGLYLVSVGQGVFGESMFTLRRDASKIALAALVAFTRAQGMDWIDCQQNTAHLASMGAAEISRQDFLSRVKRAIHQPAPAWKFESIYWNFIDPLIDHAQ